MTNNYFYDLPLDLQETIYLINIKNSKYLVNKELRSVFISVKYINKVIAEAVPELYIFMDDNNINTHVNYGAIYHNIPFLKEELMTDFAAVLSRKLSIYLTELSTCNCHNELFDEIIPSIPTIVNCWYNNMEELLCQNNYDMEADISPDILRS